MKNLFITHGGMNRISDAALMDKAFDVMKDETVKKAIHNIRIQNDRAPGNSGAVTIIETYYGGKEQCL